MIEEWMPHGQRHKSCLNYPGSLTQALDKSVTRNSADETRAAVQSLQSYVTRVAETVHQIINRSIQETVRFMSRLSGLIDGPH